MLSLTTFFFLNGHAKNIPICHNCSIHSQDHYKLLWQKTVLSCLWLRSSAESGVPGLICGQKVQAPEEQCLHPAQMPQSPHLPANFTTKTLAMGPLLYGGQAFNRVWGTVMLENDRREAKIEWKHTSTAH